MLLYGDIGEVDKHVVQFVNAGSILDRAESTEPQFIPAHKAKSQLS